MGAEDINKKRNGRPKIQSDEETIRKGYTINESLYSRMVERAVQLGFIKPMEKPNLSKYIRWLIRRDLNLPDER